jgi:hypothetical protein
MSNGINCNHEPATRISRVVYERDLRACRINFQHSVSLWYFTVPFDIATTVCVLFMYSNALLGVRLFRDTESAQAAGLPSTYCAVCHEELERGPALQLEGCRHACHLECMQQRLRAGCPGPNITFHHLTCSQCGTEGTTRSWTAMVGYPPLPFPTIRHFRQISVAPYLFSLFIRSFKH